MRLCDEDRPGRRVVADRLGGRREELRPRRVPERLDPEVVLPSGQQGFVPRAPRPHGDLTAPHCRGNFEVRELQRVEDVDAVEVRLARGQAEDVLGAPDLLERAGEAAERPARTCGGGEDQLVELRGGLDRQDAVPPMGDDADQAVTAERADVGALEDLALVDEPGRTQVGAEEHRGVGERDEERLDQRLVTGDQRADHRGNVHGSRTDGARSRALTGGRRAVGLAFRAR